MKKAHTICRLVHYENHYPLYQAIFDKIPFDSWFWASIQDLIDHDKRETTHQDQVPILHVTGPWISLGEWGRTTTAGKAHWTGADGSGELLRCLDMNVEGEDVTETWCCTFFAQEENGGEMGCRCVIRLNIIQGVFVFIIFSGLLYFILPWCDGIFAYPPYHALPFSADCRLADRLKRALWIQGYLCLSNDCRTEMIEMYPTLSLDKFKTV